MTDNVRRHGLVAESSVKHIFFHSSFMRKREITDYERYANVIPYNLNKGQHQPIQDCYSNKNSQ